MYASMSCKVNIKELQSKQRHYKRYKRRFGQNTSRSAFVSTDLQTIYKYVRQSCAEPTAACNADIRGKQKCEYNMYGNRNWSQIATEIWDVPQVQKVLMKKQNPNINRRVTPVSK
jgi:hypothetical protein